MHCVKDRLSFPRAADDESATFFLMLVPPEKWQLNMTALTAAREQSNWKKAIKSQKYLLIMIVPVMVWFAIFCYVPLYGWIMAFVNYQPGQPLLSSEFVGFQHFNFFLFSSGDFVNIMRNTLSLSGLNIFLSQIMALTFAILLNEMRVKRFKKSVQSISFLPYLISWAIVANVFHALLSVDGGMLNTVLMRLNLIDRPIFFMANPDYSWFILTFANVWKSFGYFAVIYLAGIAGIDSALYEAATIDGAGRFNSIRHIMLPALLPTIAVLLVISVGAILNTGFDQYYLLSNPLTSERSDVIDTYIVRNGLERGLLSYSTAVGVFRSVISLILVSIANAVMKVTSGNSLY